jgi:hypothetical protein
VTGIAAAPLAAISGSLVAGIAALLAWGAVFGVLSFFNRPRIPSPGVEELELPGDEPPAIAGMLTNGWRVGRDAVPATLLDLVARGFLKLDAATSTEMALRVPDRGPPGELSAFEAQVFELVRDQAVDRVVPVGALTTGRASAANKWWLRFRGSVTEEARRLGLSRPRWSVRAVIVLTALAAVPSLLISHADAGAGGSLSTSGFFFVWVPLFSFTVSLRTNGPNSLVPQRLAVERETAAGSAAAARWLGLRAHLAKDAQFATLPPAAVATWERFLAYAVAMGIAPGAEAGLPLGGSNDREVWSSYGGHWRRVRIRWPNPLQMPAPTTAGGIVAGLYLIGMSFVGFGMTLIPFTVISYLSRPVHHPAGTGGAAVLAVAVFFLAVIVIVACGVFWFGVRKLGLPFAAGEKRTVEGVVLRVRTGLIAVDDGRASTIQALTLPRGLEVERGTTVRATISSRSGRIHELTALEPPAPPEPSEHRPDLSLLGASMALTGVADGRGRVMRIPAGPRRRPKRTRA